MLEKARRLFVEYNDNNVLYCHWKSNEHLLEGLNGETDLDILVSKESKNLSDKCLKQNGFCKAIIQFGSIYPNVEEWIGYDEETGKLIHIHLHYELVTGQKHQKEYVLPWGNLMLSRRKLDEDTGVYIADSELELIVLKSRIILKTPIKRRILCFFGKVISYSDSLNKELAFLFSQISEEAVKELVQSLFGELSGKLCDYFVGKETTYSDALLYRRELVRSLEKYRRYGICNVIMSSIYFRMCFILKKITKRLELTQPIYRKRLSEEGRLVAFIGADGSGKSTVTADIEKWLTWKIEASRFYLGSGDHYNPLSKRIMMFIQRQKNKMGKRNDNNNDLALVREKKHTEELKKNTDKVGLVRHAAHIYDAFYQLQVARHCMKTLYKADRYRRKGGIALLDRYPQTQFEGINDGPKIAAQYAKIHNTPYFKYMAKKEYEYFEKMCKIQPDIVIKLYVSPEESIRRKPDHKYDEVAKKVKIIDSLIFQESETYKISTEQDFGDEIKSIRDIVWGEISK